MKAVRFTLRVFPLAILLLVAVIATLTLLGRFERTVEGSGEIQVWSYQLVRAQRAGFVEQVLVQPGDRVADGQALAILGEPGFQRQLFLAEKELSAATRALAALRVEKELREERLHPVELERQRGEIQKNRLYAEQAASQLRGAELALEAARLAFERARLLDGHGLVSAQGMHEQEQQVLLAQERLVQRKIQERAVRQEIVSSEKALAWMAGEQTRRLAEIDAEIQRLEADFQLWTRELERLDGLKDLHTLRADLGGIIVGEPSNELLHRHVQAGESLFQIIDPESIRFMSRLPEEAMVQVRRDQEAVIELVGLPKNRFRAFRGKVQRIEAQPSLSEEGIPQYPVEIQIDQPWVQLADGPFFLNSGMRGQARIVYQRDVPLLRFLLEILVGAPSPSVPMDSQTSPERIEQAEVSESKSRVSPST